MSGMQTHDPYHPIGIWRFGLLVQQDSFRRRFGKDSQTTNPNHWPSCEDQWGKQWYWIIYNYIKYNWSEDCKGPSKCAGDQRGFNPKISLLKISPKFEQQSHASSCLFYISLLTSDQWEVTSPFLPSLWPRDGALWSSESSPLAIAQRCGQPRLLGSLVHVPLPCFAGGYRNGKQIRRAGTSWQGMAISASQEFPVVHCNWNNSEGKFCNWIWDLYSENVWKCPFEISKKAAPNSTTSQGTAPRVRWSCKQCVLEHSILAFLWSGWKDVFFYFRTSWYFPQFTSLDGGLVKISSQKWSSFCFVNY